MLIILFIIMLLWQSAFSQQLGFSYTDEIITLFLGLHMVLAIIARKYRPGKHEKGALIFMLLFYLFGALATLIHDFQNDIFYGLASGVFSIKTFVCFFGARAYLQKKKISNRSLFRTLNFIEISLLLVAALLILDQFFPMFPYDSRRLGVKCSHFIFEHPTELAGFAVGSLLLSCFIREILSFKPRYLRNYFPAFIIIFITGRYKALAFYVFFVCINIVLPLMREFKLRYFVVGIPPAALVAYDQITAYFTDLTLTARGMLYRSSFLIARDFFPLGTGFGTYGTEFSRAKYSIVYSMYRMQGMYGLSPSTPYFICDTMWPAVIGETGVLGFAAIAGILYNIIKMIRKSDISSKNIVFMLYALLVYLMIESIAETIFMNSKGCLIFILLAFMLTVGTSRSKTGAAE